MIQFIPSPGAFDSNSSDRIITSGIKQRMSLITDATTAKTDFPIDWKNTAVILTRQVTVIGDKYIL